MRSQALERQRHLQSPDVWCLAAQNANKTTNHQTKPSPRRKETTENRGGIEISEAVRQIAKLLCLAQDEKMWCWNGTVPLLKFDLAPPVYYVYGVYGIYDIILMICNKYVIWYRSNYESTRATTTGKHFWRSNPYWRIQTIIYLIGLKHRSKT